jgi:tetratricopeptide (TPR) repeat protein
MLLTIVTGPLTRGEKWALWLALLGFSVGSVGVLLNAPEAGLAQFLRPVPLGVFAATYIALFLCARSIFGLWGAPRQQGSEFLRHAELGWRCVAKQAWPQAVAAAEQAVESRATEPQGYILLGAAYAGSGRTDDARGVYNDGLTKWPTHVELWGRLGELEQDVGRYEPAIRAYEKAIANGFMGATMESNVALLLLELDRREEALLHAHRAEELGLDAEDARDLFEQIGVL